MRPALKSHSSPGGFTLEDHHNLIDSTFWRKIERQNFDCPVIASGKCLVHVEQISRKQVGFFSAFCAANFDDDVFARIRIWW